MHACTVFPFIKGKSIFVLYKTTISNLWKLNACVSFQRLIVFWARCQLAALALFLSSGFCFCLCLSPSIFLSICFSSSLTFSLLFPQYVSWWMSAELSKVTCEIKRKAKQSSQQAPWELKAIFYRLPNRSLFYSLHLVINYYNKETLLNKSRNYWFGTSQETMKLIKVKGLLYIKYKISSINSICSRWFWLISQLTIMHLE